MARTSSFRPLVPFGSGRGPACLGVALVAAAALALGACDSPTAPDPEGAATSRNVATIDTGYTHFAADVTVQVSRGTSGGTGRARTFQYHVDRVRDAAGQWSTTTTRANGASPGRWRLAAARFVPGEVASSRAPVMSTSATTAATDPGTSWGRFHHVGRAAALDALTTVPDEPLASPKTVGALRATLGQQYRLATTAGDGMQHYTRASGGTTVDVALDPTVGHVQQVRVMRAGAVVLTRTYTFTRLADGIYARTAMQSQQTRRGGDAPVVTTVSYTHMVFDHTAPTAMSTPPVTAVR